MISLSVKSDIAAVVKRLDRTVWKQVPFAAAKALTDTAKDVQRELNTAIEQVFDQPTPFTQKAVGIATATKQSLSARVFLKDVQAAYLGLQITGGTRLPKRRALVLPGSGLKLNQYGNIPRGKVQQLLARKDVFSGKVRGVAGLWQRQKAGPPKLLILFEPKAQYQKRLPFYEVARATIERRLTANVEAALRSALATAR